MSHSSKPTPSERSSEDRQLAEKLVERARSEGVDLVGLGIRLGEPMTEQEQRLMSHRLAVIRRAREVTGNVAQTLQVGCAKAAASTFPVEPSTVTI